MKKVLLMTILFVTCLSLNIKAQVSINIPTATEAQANGWDALWGSYEYGYVMPENYVLADNDYVKVSLNKAANVATGTKCSDYSIALQMGSALSRESNELIYSLDDIYTGMKQPYAVLTLEAKAGGKVSLCYSRGTNNTTMYVFDVTANNGTGAYVMANSVIYADGEGSAQPHTSVVNVTKGHTYYIFGAETGANIDFYGLTFTEYSNEKYNTEAIDLANNTIAKIPTTTEAQANGWDALWGSYEYGYVMPENYVLADNDYVKVSLNKVANVATGTKCSDYSIALQMGSALSRESNELIYSLDDIYTGMKQPYAVLTLEAKAGGKVSLCYSRGTNNTTMYVFDVTANNGTGAYVMANSVIYADGEGSAQPHTSVVNVTKGHTYYIFGAETGANIDFYSLGFTGYTNENYTSGIKNIVTKGQVLSTDNKIYSIDGRFVGTQKEGLANGLYIQNGKKFIKK